LARGGQRSRNKGRGLFLWQGPERHGSDKARQAHHPLHRVRQDREHRRPAKHREATQRRVVKRIGRIHQAHNPRCDAFLDAGWIIMAHHHARRCEHAPDLLQHQRLVGAVWTNEEREPAVAQSAQDRPARLMPAIMLPDLAGCRRQIGGRGDDGPLRLVLAAC